MDNKLSRYTLRVPQKLLDKLGFIAKYNGRSKNKEIELLIKKRIESFEKKNGEIELNNKQV